MSCTLKPVLQSWTLVSRYLFCQLSITWKSTINLNTLYMPWTPSYSLRQKSLGHSNQTLFFPFSCSPHPSQSCLSQFGHQILYTNIEGTRRPQSVPTILTETVF